MTEWRSCLMHAATVSYAGMRLICDIVTLVCLKDADDEQAVAPHWRGAVPAVIP